MISVIIPAYNHEDYILDALMSVYNQTYKNIELVIIDDGSTDDTANIIIEFIANHRDRFSDLFFIRQGNKGVSATLNDAIELCNGEWIHYLASDDLFLPDKIEAQQRAINEWDDDSLALVYSRVSTMNADGSLQPNVNRWCPDPGPETESYKWLYYRNCIDASSVAFRKSAIINIGGFDESLKVEDWDCWLRLSVHYSIARVDGRYSCKRYHGLNTSCDKNMMSDNIRATLDKFRESNLVTDDMAKERAIRF